MIFFEYEQVVKIHSTLISKTGGMDGVRDGKLLDSAIKAPFQTFGGKDLYPEILDKASQLCYSLIENHPFADGNGRTGRMVMNYLLLYLGHPPIIIHEEDRKEYYSGLEAWDENQKLDVLMDFLKEQTVKTWKKQVK